MSALEIPPDVQLRPISRQRKWQLAQQRLGNCVQCGQPRQHYSHRCDECERKSAIKAGVKRPGLKVQRDRVRAAIAALPVGGEHREPHAPGAPPAAWYRSNLARCWPDRRYQTRLTNQATYIARLS